MNALCVLYDETCGFCCSCARWLSTQRQHLPVHCIPRQSPEAREAFGDFDNPLTRPELIVVDDDGGVYRDADAWVVTLWALKGYRGWSTRLAQPMLKPFSRAFFEVISSGRHTLSKLLALDSDVVLQQKLALLDPKPWVKRCEGDQCAVPLSSSGGYGR